MKHSLDDKKEMILARQRIFAEELGRRVLFKPQLHVWMILIPIIFVFYLQDLMKYKNGRREFADNFLLSHFKALNEAADALAAGREPDAEAIARQSGLQSEAEGEYAHYLQMLIEHYHRLLQAEGNDYEALIRAAYDNNHSNFLLYINQLHQAEVGLNRALSPELHTGKEGAENVTQVITRIEAEANRLRRREAEEIFRSNR